MKMMKTAMCVLVVTMVAMPSLCSAQVALTQNAPNNDYGNTCAQNGDQGWGFLATQNITVSELGLATTDITSSSQGGTVRYVAIIDSNVGAASWHTVWYSNPTTVASAPIDATQNVSNGYAWADIAPVTLLAGHSYLVVAATNVGDSFDRWGGAAAPTVASGMTLGYNFWGTWTTDGCEDGGFASDSARPDGVNVQWAPNIGNDTFANAFYSANFMIQQFIPGDINGDGLVDVADYNIWAANVGRTGATWAQGDLNGDGLVDVADYNIWAANVGKTAATPEPISMIILAIGGGLVALKRRNG
jgi:hypothetical protein